MIKPLKTFKLPDNLDEEIQAFDEVIQKFKSGEFNHTEFKVVRVPFGVYEQRKKDTYMVRIRCAGSVVTPEQLKKIAEISKEHAASYIHLTTRQEIQLHYVLIDSIIPVINELKTVGLSPRGGGGNTVRNIVAEDEAGIAHDEAFDVTPHAIALTTRLASEPDSWNLPRKFKFAFSGSAEDRGYATIHDIGYIAQIKDGQRGFKVYVAGGLGAKTEVGHLLFDFIPEEEAYNVAKAAKNLFYKNGNRKNKHASRLRFLWKKLGEEEFLRIYFEEYEAVKKENYQPLDIEEIDNAGVDPNTEIANIEDSKDFDLWRQRFVRNQRQEGIFSIILPTHLGHVDNDVTVALAEFLSPFGDNVLRIRKDQNFLIRNIPEKYLPNLYNFLKEHFDNFNRPFIIDKVIACAGASTCQLGICLSPGAATATKRQLEQVDLDLDAVADAKINISGCPNSCGQHHVGDLGFFGKVIRKGNRVYPAYNVVAGSKVKDGETQLAQKVGEIPSRNLPGLVQETFRKYIAKKDNFESFNQYMLTEEGKADLADTLQQYKTAPEFEEDQNYYFDWGTDKIFSVSDKGKGECSAGLFDLIESDLGNIQKTKKLIDEIDENGGDPKQKQQLLKDVVFFSARTLLIARAVQAKSEQDAYHLFREYFINGGLVKASYNELLIIAESNDYSDLLNREDEVYALADRMKLLYDVMTPAFGFNLPDGEQLHTDKVEIVTSQNDSQTVKTDPNTTETESKFKPTAVKDFRGVGCPMNFVKTKMELSKLNGKDILEIWLDDGAPIENVPGSVRQEGHNILEQTQIDGYWKVVIEKA